MLLKSTSNIINYVLWFKVREHEFDIFFIGLRIVLCKWAFGLTPPPSERKGGGICLKWIDETFTTPLADANKEVLWGTKSIMNLMCWLFVKFAWIIMIILMFHVGMWEHVYSICFVVCYLFT